MAYGRREILGDEGAGGLPSSAHFNSFRRFSYSEGLTGMLNGVRWSNSELFASARLASCVVISPLPLAVVVATLFLFHARGRSRCRCLRHPESARRGALRGPRGGRPEHL